MSGAEEKVGLEGGREGERGASPFDLCVCFDSSSRTRTAAVVAVAAEQIGT
jgi:hypothetical protein